MEAGVMEKIRELFGEGKSSGAIIAMGFKASTVYKIQRSLRKQGAAQRGRSLAVRSAPSVTALAGPTEAEFQAIRIDRDQLEALVEHLAEETGELDTLRARIASLELEVDDATQLRERVEDLEQRLQETSEGHAEMSQAATRWRAKFEAEGASRRHTEQQLRKQCEDERARRINAEEQWGLWHSNAEELEVENQALKGTVVQLQPLQVWAGHPCKVCKRPLSGVVSRGDAAKLMENYGHTECLKNESNSGIGWVVGGAAGLYALSRMRQGS